MFNTRLKQWNIRKNYRAEEKEVLAARIAQAHLESRSISHLTFKDRPVKLDRVLRHLRTTRRGTATLRKANRASKPQLSDEDSASDSSTSMAIRDNGFGALPNTSQAPSTVTPESGVTNSTVLTPPSCSEDIAELDDMIKPDDTTFTVADPPLPLFPPKGALNTELILRQTQAYYQHTFGTANGSQSGGQASVAKVFWTNVKTGIYFLKKQSPTLAWPLLNDACVLAADIFSQAPTLFLSQAFTVLSPVNTRVYPRVRSTMLRYLADMASLKLMSAQHPLAVILRELSLDNERGEASEQALKLTLALFRRNFGADHSATFAVHRSLITLLRRDKRLGMAKEQGECLAESTKWALFSGPHTGLYQNKPTSLSLADLCAALTELVHIHIDLQQYGLAKGICSSILQNYKLMQGIEFPDSQAAYAMEDMAEVCSRMGDCEEAAYWLREALDASSMIRGNSNATTEHIRDKLRHCTEDCHRNDSGMGTSGLGIASS